MNSRLQRFLSAENISQSQFADIIGVAKASVSHILAGRNKPGFDFIENMARHFPALNIEWLITGKGKMYKSQPDEPGLFPASELQGDEIDMTIETAAPVSSFNTSAENNHNSINQSSIERVIVFFKDGTFKEYR